MWYQPGKDANPFPFLRHQAEQGKLTFPCPCSCLRIWSRETGLVVPSRASLVIFHAQAEIWGALVLLTGFLPIFAAASIYLYRHTPSGQQSRFYRITQLRSDGVERSLPRVRQHRASSPQGSSSNSGCCLLKFHQGPINVRLSFPIPTIGVYVVGMYV